MVVDMSSEIDGNLSSSSLTHTSDSTDISEDDGDVGGNESASYLDLSPESMDGSVSDESDSANESDSSDSADESDSLDSADHESCASE